MEEKVIERKTFKSRPAKIQKENTDDGQKTEVLLEYSRNWIDIPKFESKGISALWRGWYIIPDQGYITDKKISDLKSYLPFINGGIHQTDEKYKELLERFVINSDFQTTSLRTSYHGLFVRQAKNYLIKLGWCFHPIKENGKLDKKTLCLTDLGSQINQCDNLESVRILYTDYFINYSFNGLFIVRFTKNLLQVLDNLTLNEFNYFVTHAYNDDDFDIIVDLIRIYRSLSNTTDFNNSLREYFEHKKGGTAENVYGNYLKNCKHTVSVIGWCKEFSVSENFTLRLNNENE